MRPLQAKTCDELRTNVFDAKTDKGSADLYFYYYGMFQHQQNMLQDTIRTGEQPSISHRLFQKALRMIPNC